ncbi:hypothetical protein [Marinicauda algicola]|uniref:hypothetical protein n=1 Tax=Marinicauda algicola TaxID=2029849 RepID=UPI00130535D1|nr:hypothetical protein [Marinicauda algicola]
MTYTSSAYGKSTARPRSGARGLVAALGGLFDWLARRAGQEGGHLDPGRKV